MVTDRNTALKSSLPPRSLHSFSDSCNIFTAPPSLTYPQPARPATPMAPLATLRTASQAVAAPSASATARRAPARAIAAPRRPRAHTAAAANDDDQAWPAAAASGRAQLPTRRAFLNGALKVSIAGASMLSSMDDMVPAAPLPRSLSSAALAADAAVHTPRAASAGAQAAAHEFEHASVLPVPLKPFGGPASLAAAPTPLHQVNACCCSGPVSSPASALAHSHPMPCVLQHLTSAAARPPSAAVHRRPPGRCALPPAARGGGQHGYVRLPPQQHGVRQPVLPAGGRGSRPRHGPHRLGAAVRCGAAGGPALGPAAGGVHAAGGTAGAAGARARAGMRPVLSAPSARLYLLEWSCHPTLTSPRERPRQLPDLFLNEIPAP